MNKAKYFILDSVRIGAGLFLIIGGLFVFFGVSYGVLMALPLLFKIPAAIITAILGVMLCKAGVRVLEINIGE